MCCYTCLDMRYALSLNRYEYTSVVYFIGLINVLLTNELFDNCNF